MKQNSINYEDFIDWGVPKVEPAAVAPSYSLFTGGFWEAETVADHPGRTGEAMPFPMKRLYRVHLCKRYRAIEREFSQISGEREYVTEFSGERLPSIRLAVPEYPAATLDANDQQIIAETYAKKLAEKLVPYRRKDYFRAPRRHVKIIANAIGTEALAFKSESTPKTLLRRWLVIVNAWQYQEGIMPPVAHLAMHDIEVFWPDYPVAELQEPEQCEISERMATLVAERLATKLHPNIYGAEQRLGMYIKAKMLRCLSESQVQSEPDTSWFRTACWPCGMVKALITPVRDCGACRVCGNEPEWIARFEKG
ncbi:MAG: hypothetical protein FIA97_20250 [Methylococcaceae bacterium]|nr:hypothetical protein [Methylococcaceae bacterium]